MTRESEVIGGKSIPSNKSKNNPQQIRSIFVPPLPERFEIFAEAGNIAASLASE